MAVSNAAHRAGVARLRESYAVVPADQQVRLAKSSSNLFRPRTSARDKGLDVSGLTGVLWVDPETRTAEVQGMCTYEHLVAETLPHGLIPLVVPQLRTITLGGAVSGLGIEATSFRNGLPHESVLEMDVFTGSGDVLTTKPGDELFDAFPNSYGSLGYATRLRIELEEVQPYVALRHVPFADHASLESAISEVVETRQWEGERVDAVDGTVFGPGDIRLTLARWTDEDGLDTPPRASAATRPARTSDYTGQQVYYRSVHDRRTDLLTIHDYLWRWDTDWFWCSAAFGAQHPVVRRVWPRRWRRSDVYHRLVGLDHRLHLVDRLDRRAGRPQRERVVQDVEVPVERLGEFLEWFDREVGMRPVWLCPVVSRGSTGSAGEGRPWPCYPLQPGRTYVNVGFWGTVPVGPDAPHAPRNRAIEAKVLELGGHKSLYSEAFYDRETFDRLYGGDQLAQVKARHDPDGRLPTLYDKAVRRR